MKSWGGGGRGRELTSETEGLHGLCFQEHKCHTYNTCGGGCVVSFQRNISSTLTYCVDSTFF
jgi:hypothetical protein